MAVCVVEFRNSVTRMKRAELLYGSGKPFPAFITDLCRNASLCADLLSSTIHAPFAGRNIRRVSGAPICCIGELALAPMFRPLNQFSRFAENFFRRHFTDALGKRRVRILFLGSR